MVTYTSSTNSVLPWWVWVAGIVIIAFFAGWLIMKHNAPKADVAEAGSESVKKEAAESKSVEKKTAGEKSSAKRKSSVVPNDKPSVVPDNKPNEPPK